MTAMLVRDGWADGWVVSPLMGDQCVLLTLFLDPETDVTCTITLVIQRSIDACGGLGGGGRYKGQALANGMPHCITVLQEPGSLRQ